MVSGRTKKAIFSGRVPFCIHEMCWAKSPASPSIEGVNLMALVSLELNLNLEEFVCVRLELK
jgi:hypothetical protein